MFVTSEWIYDTSPIYKTDLLALFDFHRGYKRWIGNLSQTSITRKFD